MQAENLKDLGKRKEEPIQGEIGKLRFLADRIKLDLAYATSFLVRFAAEPTP